MKLSIFIAPLAVLLATHLVSSAPVEPNNGDNLITSDPSWFPLGTEDLSTGILTYWGRESNTTSASAHLHAKCGDNKLVCDWKNNRAYRPMCTILIKILEDRFWEPLPLQAAVDGAICHGSDTFERTARCCITWKDRHAEILHSHLIPAAWKIADNCRSGPRNNWVSGMSKETNLAGWCTTQYMSNRI